MLTSSRSGVVLAVHDLGGAGPSLLLTHSTGFHGFAYPGLVARLAENFSVVSFDFRAHGDSTRPADGDLSWRGMADDVLAAVDAACLDDPFGVGHSMGGTALVLAENARPGTFRALYLYEPPIFHRRYPTPMTDEIIGRTRRRRSVFDSREVAYANFAAKPPLNELDPESLRAYVDHGFADREDGTVELKCTPEDEAAIYQTSLEAAAADVVPTIGCPTTIAMGNGESEGPAELGPLQATRLPHGRLVVLPGLGHLGPQHAPDIVARSIMEHLLGG